MARELSEDDYDRWQKKLEEKQDADEGDETSVEEHDGARLLLGDRSEGSEEWLRFERKEVKKVEQ